MKVAAVTAKRFLRQDNLRPLTQNLTRTVPRVCSTWIVSMNRTRARVGLHHERRGADAVAEEPDARISVPSVTPVAAKIRLSPDARSLEV